MRLARFCRVFTALALVVGGFLSAVRAGSFSSAVEMIRAKTLRRHCEVLASDTFEGREAGSRGGQAAGAYLVSALRTQKVRPAGIDGDYYQPFPPSSRNVLAILVGRDPVLKKEYILVGAHYDHVGYGSARNSRGPIGYIHNGADDNASGVSALLEVINAFSSLDAPPKRSVLFVFWDGEEQGLLGSQYWIYAPTVPLNKIRLVFNVDMVGRLRGNRAEVFGTRTAPGLRRLLSAQNVESPVALNFTWETRRDSDHYNFFAQQIPYLMVFTGKHAEYHTPYDDVDKLNVEGIERVARLLFRTVFAAADGPPLSAFRPASLQEGASDQAQAEMALPALPSRLGITWDLELAKKNVIEITEIEPGSSAGAAGLQPGDRLLQFADRRIRTGDDLREAVFGAGEQATAVVARPGEKSPRALTVRLPRSDDRFGLSCRADDAEPNCAIITRVAPGSPMYRAGLRVNDRIQNVAGASFESIDQFRAILARQSGTFRLGIEREGEPRMVEIELRSARPAAGPIRPH